LTLLSPFLKILSYFIPTESGLALRRGSLLGGTFDSNGKLKLDSSDVIPGRVKQKLLLWDSGELPHKNFKIAHHLSLKTQI
jgi:hypothetical protein